MGMTSTETRGAVFRRLRTERGLSQEAAARGIGLATVTYGKWERDEVNPEPENLLRAAAFFGVDPDVLGFQVPAEYNPQAPAWFTEAMAALREQQQQQFEQLQAGQRAILERLAELG